MGPLSLLLVKSFLSVFLSHEGREELSALGLGSAAPAAVMSWS